MPLTSMTGFGRAEGHRGAASWVWELRSVNGRSLDLRLRLPPGFEALEPLVRDRVQKRLTRGSLTVNLQLRRAEAGSTLRLDEQALATVIAAAEQASRRLQIPSQVNVDGLLGLRGVLLAEDAAETPDEIEARQKALLSDLDRALDGLVQARRAEGGRLHEVLAGHVKAVEGLVADVRAAPSRQPAQVRARLDAQIERLISGAGAGLDPHRLHQEAVLLATRIDVEEELVRLTAHIAAARALLDSAEPAGRKLDFLTQEFNREANTLCSKGNDLDVTRPGLALKAVIDQMREQVQNIE